MSNTFALPAALVVELEERDLEVYTGAQFESFVDLADEVSEPSWPEFMLHDAVANKYWYPLNEKYEDFQFSLIHKKTKQWIAVGNSIPVFWDKTFEELPDAGWDWALRSGIENKMPPNLLCALAIQVLPEFRGQGLSTIMINIMKELGHLHGFDQLIAPVRPNKKCDYPLLPMQDYIDWTVTEERFDPWLRVHERLGARLIKVCPEAMVISDTPEAWEKWTGMSFQTSGDYIVPGALSTVQVNLEGNNIKYTEPNVWMIHRY